jgi:hypothetical protein
MSTVFETHYPQPASIHRSRIYSRRRLDLRARLLASSKSGEQFTVYGWMCDLSCSGAGLTLTRELPSGSEVVLCLRLPGDYGQLSLRAVIRRQQGFRAGLEFLPPTPEQRLMLTELCYS